LKESTAFWGLKGGAGTGARAVFINDHERGRSGNSQENNPIGGKPYFFSRVKGGV